MSVRKVSTFSEGTISCMTRPCGRSRTLRTKRLAKREAPQCPCRAPLAGRMRGGDESLCRPCGMSV
eukprot:8981896-Pyramimonas_sp.AAC.1